MKIEQNIGEKKGNWVVKKKFMPNWRCVLFIRLFFRYRCRKFWNQNFIWIIRNQKKKNWKNRKGATVFFPLPVFFFCKWNLSNISCLFFFVLLIFSTFFNAASLLLQKKKESFNLLLHFEVLIWAEIINLNWIQQISKQTVIYSFQQTESLSYRFKTVF